VGAIEQPVFDGEPNLSEAAPCVTPFVHKPVLLREVLEALRPRPGGRYVDGTVGGGGHAAAILAASAPDGWLFGCDRDAAALAAARERLAEFAGRFELRQGNFADLAEWIPAGSCDGVLLDLGVSSAQLDSPERGFSFQQEGPLDMRMDPRQGLTAAELVNRWPPETLAKLFVEYGEVPRGLAWRVARRIASERARRAGGLQTTRELAALIEREFPRAGRRTHPATKFFQALRLAVNDEPGSLKRGLEAAWTILRPGGRLAVICFHSLEARLVKAFGRSRTQACTFPGGTEAGGSGAPRPPDAVWVTRKAIRPGAAEVAANPRSRSAQLRVLEKREGR
jgi:16S rRNA (cytosine1402-N4)-methyltransferase